MSSKRDSWKQNLSQRGQTFKILIDYAKFPSKISSFTKTGWKVHTLALKGSHPSAALHQYAIFANLFVISGFSLLFQNISDYIKIIFLYLNNSFTSLTFCEGSFHIFSSFLSSWMSFYLLLMSRNMYDYYKYYRNI